MNKLLIALPIISLLTVGILLFNNTQDSSLTSSTTSIKQWNLCRKNQYQIRNICFSKYNFSKTLSQFNEVTSENSSVECQQHLQYIATASINEPLNKQNYFEDCYLSEKAQEIAKSDDCFWSQYYYPIYSICGGF